MLAFFRRSVKSWVFYAFFGILAVGVVITGFENPSAFLGDGSAATGKNVANAGGKTISEAEAAQAIQNALRNLGQPNVDMAMFVREGGVDTVINQLVNATALKQFADQIGLRVSRRLIDGEIAGMAEFRGPSGKFDEATFRAQLANAGLAEAKFRDNLTQAALLRMMLTPVSGGARATPGFVRPYALLQLEKRAGTIVALPSLAFAGGPPPSAAAIQAYYRANTGRYTLPERRVLRYAIIDPATRFAGRITPTEAQIAAAYKADASRYAARQDRALTQIIVPDQAQADAFARRLRAGENPANVARASGLQPLTVPLTDQSGFARQSSETVAAAAFAPTVPQGGVVVQRGPLGFAVIRVDSIVNVPARTLDDARPEIATNLVRQQTDEAVAKEIAAIEADADKRVRIPEIATKYGLTVTTSAPVSAQGAVDPGAPPLPPEVAPMLETAFLSQAGDLATVTPIDNGQRFVLWDVERVLPSAPRPMAAVQAQLVQDVIADTNNRRARTAAEALLAKVNSGTPLPEAIRSVGTPLPPPQTFSAVRRDVMSSTEAVPAPLEALFTLRAGRGRLIEAPEGQGYMVVVLNRVDGANPAAALALEGAAIQPFGSLLAQEYMQQFTNAVRGAVGVKLNPAAVAELKQALTRGGASAP